MWTLRDSLGSGAVVEAAAAPQVPDLVSFARERLGFWPDSRQEGLLRSKASRGMVCCSRQWGKSTVAAVMAVHRAFFYPKSLVVVACPSEKQSAELVWKIRDFLAKLGVARRGDGSNRISLTLPNGSRIVGLPGREATLRGFSAVSLMIIDEAARVEDSVYKALRPMLAVGGGELWLLSTPFGTRGFFWENWDGGGEEWERTTVKATECPRISRRFLEEEKRQLGDLWFRQEYLCEFVEDGRSLFSRELVLACFDDDEPLDFGTKLRA
ncbi:MAG TPA: terminase family protein [Bryobacteraceae bacterium]|jgi:hypothetical protein